MKARSLIGLAVIALLTILSLGIGDQDINAGLFQSPLPVPPPNDDFDSATVISGLPFSEALDTSQATWASDDPPDCVNTGSVWYAFSPASDMYIEMNTAGSQYDTVLSVYTGTRGALSLVPGACNDDYYGLQSRVAFHATAGTTYYAMVGVCCSNGGDGGGYLVFNANEIAAPANDPFDGAMVVPGLPFEHSVDTTGASIEPGEPEPGCAGGSMGGTVWYAFAPSQSGSTMALAQDAWYGTSLAVYTGATLSSLQEVTSRCGWEPVAFRAEAGTTYYVQVAPLHGYSGPLRVFFDHAPPPVADFWYYPYEPSTLDSIYFDSYSYDPVNIGIESHEWSFGDGSSETGCCPTHRYAADGDYEVDLRVETYDGRENTASRIVSVQTHDIAITGIQTPRTAKSNQTRRIVVRLANKRYTERVDVQLYRSTPWGFDYVDSVNVRVPARRNGGTTSVWFTYSYRPEDAQIGKVTFKVMAYIVDHRDAFPADNEATSAPIKVIR